MSKINQRINKDNSKFPPGEPIVVSLIVLSYCIVDKSFIGFGEFTAVQLEIAYVFVLHAYKCKGGVHNIAGEFDTRLTLHNDFCQLAFCNEQLEPLSLKDIPC